MDKNDCDGDSTKMLQILDISKGSKFGIKVSGKIVGKKFKEIQ